MGGDDGKRAPEPESPTQSPTQSPAQSPTQSPAQSPTESPAQSPTQSPTESPAGGQRCDFCGAVVPRVRRIALDRDYERLHTPHPVRYACPQCSEKKERDRRGL